MTWILGQLKEIYIVLDKGLGAVVMFRSENLVKIAEEPLQISIASSL